MDQRSAGDGRPPAGVSDELDRLLAPVDSALAAIYPGQPRRRQPVHTIYVPVESTMTQRQNRVHSAGIRGPRVRLVLCGQSSAY